MDTESSLEDTSTIENTSPKSGKNCKICHQSLHSPDDNSSSCLICSQNVCESCSTLRDNSRKRQCNKCVKFLNFLPVNLIKDLSSELLTNSELLKKHENIQKEIQQNKQKLHDMDEEAKKIPEKKIIIDTLKVELAENIKKIHEITIEIKTLTNENTELECFINEKEEKIGKLTQELEKIKSEVQECKKNSNFIPPDCGEVYRENEELKARLKEIEKEHMTYTQQMIEALELLKVQLYREKTENSELKMIVESSHGDETFEALEVEKAKARELQEELKIAKRQLELMRGSRIEDKELEELDKDNIDDPSGKPCKCLIY
ncbi:hypothetical protein SteCoe_21661 [Stentor coeruleus]|uniref:Uncharacterized protein n=1 Tax=Stentor coeruleus TaxID=5963 RepID=A0A1R2BP44_9CILI|nr:hypothetical protein SteCoe_21661 [Stentor coeruleus]